MPIQKRDRLSLTAERLRELLFYDPETGEFTYRVRRGSYLVGTKAIVNRQNSGKTRYWVIGIDHHYYLAHRLAWLYVHGRWPVTGIDHINGDRRDNRIANLREADQSRNGCNRGLAVNNKTGFKGVYRGVGESRYCAQICRLGKKIKLGRFDTPEAAARAYDAAAAKIFGEFAWLNFPPGG